MLAAAHPAPAQAAADLPGHWKGAIRMPSQDAPIEIDFRRDQQGKLGGTASMPDEKLFGVVLLAVSVEGTTVKFHARSDQRFEGELDAGGDTLAGNFLIEGHTVPFDLTRAGPARPESAATGAFRELEGSWRGTVAAGGAHEDVELELSPSPCLILLDEGSLRIRVSRSELSGSAIDLEIGGGYATYKASLQAGELTGTYRMGGVQVPLRLHR